MHGAGKILGKSSQFIHGHDLTAHKYRLSQCHGSEKHVMNVELHRFFRDQCHRLGHVLAVGSLDRLSGVGILHQIELIGLCGQIKSLGGEHLGRIEQTQILLVVEISAIEINGRQISGKSFLFLIAGSAYLFGADQNLFVVLKCEFAALLQRELLRLGHRHDPAEHCKTER